MQEILKQISSIDGVIGSSLFSDQGKLLAHACPPLLDTAQLEKGSNVILECLHNLQISQTIHNIDLRFSEGRILVRTLPNAFLCVPCAKNANLSMVNITLNLAIKKLEQMLTHNKTTQPKTAQPAINTEGMDLKVAHFQKNDPSGNIDQLGMVAVCHVTAKNIADALGKAPKKLKITTKNGASGVFSIMVINDLNHKYEGRLVIGVNVEKKIKVADDEVVNITLG